MAPTRSERIPADGTAGNGSTAGSDTWSRTRWPVGGRAGDRGECADRDGGRLALSRAKTVMPSMVLVWADGGYAVRLVAWVAEHCRMTLDIVRKPKGKQGFSVLPHRWLIERTLAWIERCRRLGHDYECLPEHSEAMIKWAMIGLMSRRPVPARARRLGQSTSRPARRDTFATPSKTNRKLLSQFPIPGSTTCAIVREFDALFDGRKGVRAVIHQRFPELRPPFTTGLNSRADNVIAHARRRKEAAHALDS